MDVSSIAIHIPDWWNCWARYLPGWPDILRWHIIWHQNLAVGQSMIQCSSVEFVTMQPPLGQHCGAYLLEYISNEGGYLINPGATEDCKFCSTRTTDEFLANAFNIDYTHHWRDFGLMMVYLIFNVRFWHRDICEVADLSDRSFAYICSRICSVSAVATCSAVSRNFSLGRAHN